MDVTNVSKLTLAPLQPSKGAPELHPGADALRSRVKELEAQHTARAFGANEAINAQGQILGRHLNETA